MKKYIKPEIEIVEFEVFDKITNDVMYDPFSGGPNDWETDSAEVFYGVKAGEEGYIVNNF